MFTNDDELAKKLRMVANHGQEKRYYHDVIGVNSRLDTIQAAILKIKLKHLDAYCTARQVVADYYNKAFSKISEITCPKVGAYTDHVYHQYTIKLDGINRDDFQAELAKIGVPTNIYYPLPAHLQKGFSNVSSRKGDLRITESLMQTVVSLPIHTEMDEKQLKFITEAVASYIKKHTKVAVQ